MRIRDIKQKSLSSLLPIYKKFIVYSIIITVIIYRVLAIRYYILFDVILMGLLFYMIIGAFDLEKANFFIKLAKQNNIDNHDFFELSNNMSHTIYRIFLNSYIKKFVLLIAAFWCFRINLKHFILTSYLYRMVTIKSFNAFLSFIALGIFVYFLMKYIFVEYILVEKCTEVIEAEKNGNDSKYNLYDFKSKRSFIFGNKYLTKEIYEENRRLVKSNYSVIMKFVFSFAGWFLLSIITFGLGFAFLIPYFNSATALLYLELKETQSL